MYLKYRKEKKVMNRLKSKPLPIEGLEENQFPSAFSGTTGFTVVPNNISLQSLLNFQ